MKKSMYDILFEHFGQYISLNDDEKNAIISSAMFHSIKKGTIILREGQRSKDSYFVMKGCLRKYYLIESEEKTTDFYTEMEALTPRCVLSDAPSEYYISCVEDSIITITNPDMELSINTQFPRLESLCRMFSEDLLAKQQIVFDEYKTSTPEQRYHNLLLNKPNLVQRVPQHQLASYLGITPQSLSRLRARIAKKK